jgi:PAS domain S-box-containing protein
MATGVARPRSPPLRKSEYRRLAETATDAIIAGNSRDRISFANAAAARLFGHPVDAMLGEPLSMLMPERFREAHHSGFMRFAATGQGRLVGTTLQVSALHAEGWEIPVEIALGTLGEGDARVVTGVIRDLTERDRLVRHQAAQLAVTAVLAGEHTAAETPSLILEGLTRALGWDFGALWMLEDDGQVRMRHHWQADPAATTGFARASAELSLEPGRGLAGRTLVAAEPVWLDDVASAEQFLRRDAAEAAGLRGALSLPLIVRGRTVGVLECFTRAKLRADPKLRDLLMTVASQVGEHLQRLETHEALEIAQARFESAFEQAPAGMALVGMDGVCLDVNPALCRLTGRAHDALVGGRLRDLAHAEDVRESISLFERMVAGALDGFEVELRFVHADGQDIWTLVRASLVPHPRARYCIVHVQDITVPHLSHELQERHAVELERSNAALERFAHVAAHELRAPLSTIGGLGDVLLRRLGAELGEEERKPLELIVDNARAGGRFLDNLLAYARAGAVAPRAELIATGALVSEVLEALHVEIEERHAQVAVGELPSVHGDRAHVAQVFQNLVSNAVKFTPAERRPEITVAGERENGFVRFSVTDNGIGVAPREAESVFEMFARSADGSSYQGTGIGLGVCARLVGSHGGRIWVEPAPGRGSCFCFTLPAAAGA